MGDEEIESFRNKIKIKEGRFPFYYRILDNLEFMRFAHDEDIRLINLNYTVKEIYDNNRISLLDMLCAIEVNGEDPRVLEVPYMSRLDYGMSATLHYLCTFPLDRNLNPRDRECVESNIIRVLQLFRSRKLTEQEYQFLITATPDEIIDDWLMRDDIAKLERKVVS